MGWLRRTLDKQDGGRKEKPREITGQARQQFITLATSFLGRGVGEGADAFDDQVRSAIGSASQGAEVAGFEELVNAIRVRGIPITIAELSAFGRSARAFGVHEDGWTFLGECVAKEPG